VLPGRYAGPAIPIHSGPTPQQVARAAERAEADVLALGRTRRLVSRALRRALMIRDRMCRFPGCHQTRHLQAHHRVSWADGGATDLDNLILLCQWHHTAVHEGGMSIRPDTSDRGTSGWVFVMPDGSPHRPKQAA
jgi:predicted restriction endonuclease